MLVGGRDVTLGGPPKMVVVVVVVVGEVVNETVDPYIYAEP